MYSLSSLFSYLISSTVHFTGSGRTIRHRATKNRRNNMAEENKALKKAVKKLTKKVETLQDELEEKNDQIAEF